MNEFAQIVSSVGFPIACSIWLLYQSSKLNDIYKEAMQEMRKAIMNNTKSIDKLSNIVEDLKALMKE